MKGRKDIPMTTSFVRPFSIKEVIDLSEWLSEYLDVRSPDRRDWLLKTLIRIEVVKSEDIFTGTLEYPAEAKTGDIEVKAYVESVLRELINILQTQHKYPDKLVDFLNSVFDMIFDGAALETRQKWKGFREFLLFMNHESLKECGIDLSLSNGRFELAWENIALSNPFIMKERILEMLEKIKKRKSLYSDYFLNLIALVDNNKLTLLHADIIFSQGQHLIDTVGKYNHDHLRVVRESQSLDIDDLIRNISQGFIRTKGEGDIYLPSIHPKEVAWHKYTHLADYLPNGIPSLLNIGLGLIFNTRRKLDKLIIDAGYEVKEIIETIEMKPYRSLMELMSKTVGQQKNEGHDSEIRIFAPGWCGFHEDIWNEKERILEVNWHIAMHAAELVKLHVFFEILTPHDGHTIETSRTRVGYYNEVLSVVSLQSVFTIPENALDTVE